MIYGSRILSATCARLGYLFRDDEPLRPCSRQKLLLDVWGLSVLIVISFPITFLVPIVIYTTVVNALDCALNPPEQYFEGGAWVWRNSVGPSIVVNAKPPSYVNGATSLCRQQSISGSEPVAQNLGNSLFPDFMPLPDCSPGLNSFQSDIMGQNLLSILPSFLACKFRKGILVLTQTLPTSKAGGTL